MGNPLGEIYGQDGGGSQLDNGYSGMQDPGQQSQGLNPSFQPLLADIPQELHEKVIPHLRSWDSGVTQRFQQLQSNYKPWETFATNGHTPENVQQALNVLNVLENNPEVVYKALVENYKFGQEQQVPAGGDQGQQQQPQIEEDIYAPRFKQLESNFERLAGHFLEQQRREQEAQADMALAKEFDDARKAVGQFDEDWVRAHCLANPKLTVTDAAKQYQNWERAQQAKWGARPIITGSSSGGVPGSSNSDPTKWSGKETRANVAAMIRQANIARSES